MEESRVRASIADDFHLQLASARLTNETQRRKTGIRSGEISSSVNNQYECSVKLKVCSSLYNLFAFTRVSHSSSPSSSPEHAGASLASPNEPLPIPVCIPPQPPTSRIPSTPSTPRCVTLNASPRASSLEPDSSGCTAEVHARGASKPWLGCSALLVRPPVCAYAAVPSLSLSAGRTSGVRTCERCANGAADFRQGLAAGSKCLTLDLSQHLFHGG